MQILIIGLILLASYCDGFIAPLEVHRLQENILLLPTIFKGTDSRLGFGFRLGNHADFQSIFEIGPQKSTKPLEKRAQDEYSSSSKRMVSPVTQAKVVGLPQPQLNSAEYYPQKRSFSTRDQYPIPKSISNDYKSSSQRSKSITRTMLSKMMKAPITLVYRRNSGKMKKSQQLKDDLMDVAFDE